MVKSLQTGSAGVVLAGLAGASGSVLAKENKDTKDNQAKKGAPIKGGEITKLSALELSQAIRQKRVSCVETMEAYLEHIGRKNRIVSAIVSLQPKELLMEEAKEKDRLLAAGQYQGWMHGFPHAVKDLAFTKGIRTTSGSLLFKDYVPNRDSVQVARIRQAGAIIIGKTNTPEFGLGSQTYNRVFDTTRNAYNHDLCAGGSSGGAAVALAAHLVPVADGSDMMGSLRNPAAYNNVFGFRPSAGRVPMALWTEVFYQQLGCEGPMGRTMSDLAMLLSTQAGYDKGAPLSLTGDPSIYAKPLKASMKGKKIAWMGDYQGYLPMEDGVLALCEKSLKDFQTIGCVVDAAVPAFDMAVVWKTWLTLRQFLVGGSLSALYTEQVKRDHSLKQEAVWEIEESLKLSANDVYQASVQRGNWYNALLKMFETYDYLLLPTAQVFPFSYNIEWPKRIAGKSMQTYHQWMEIVVGPSLAGLPTLNVPVGFNDQGLPMGISIIGKPQDDLSVLQLGYAYEQATQWVQKQPSPLITA